MRIVSFVVDERSVKHGAQHGARSEREMADAFGAGPSAAAIMPTARPPPRSRNRIRSRLSHAANGTATQLDAMANAATLMAQRFAPLL